MPNWINKLLTISVLGCLSANSFANSSNNTAFRNRYASATENAGCQVCHTSSTSSFNAYGSTLSGLGGSIGNRLIAAEPINSDGDSASTSNIQEIRSGTQPGWRNGQPGRPSGTMDPANPVAVINGPYLGVSGSAVSFSSSGSSDSDPNGFIASYLWNFGDGFTSGSSNPTHTYSSPGTYTVTLTVTDNIGKTANGSVQATISAPVIAKILLIDDDGDSPDLRDFYTAPLDAIGLPYDIWDISSQGIPPDAVALSVYDYVIWYTGNKLSDVGPDAAAEASLSSYLDNGGNLFLSSQDYYYSRFQTDFMTSYLGIESVTDDVAHTRGNALGIYQGILASDFPLAFFLSDVMPVNNYTDRVIPDSTAQTVMEGDQGSMGLLKRTATYSTMFWALPFASIGDNNARTSVLRSFLGNAPVRDVLLVDDDGDASSRASLEIYAETLETLGYSYSVWDKSDRNFAPQLSTYRQYRDIIWFTGGHATFQQVGPEPVEQRILSDYLEEGGRLLFSSQDFTYGRNYADMAPFVKTFFGIDAFYADVNYPDSTGVGEFVAVGEIGLTTPFTNFSDGIMHDNTAAPILRSYLNSAVGEGSTAVLKRTGKYLAVYLGFPFESVNSDDDRINLLRSYLRAEIDNQTCFPVVAESGFAIICF